MKLIAAPASIWAMLSMALFMATALCSGASRERPNIVIILADDQGWGDLSVHGNLNLKTPNIDSLARDGALFEHFYVCSVCAPTRAEFLTGRYHPRSGVRGITRGAERLNLDEETIADAFRSAGYATGAFGKWHNGAQYPYHPNARGFDEFYGFCAGYWGQYSDPLLEHNGKPVRGKGYIADDLTEADDPPLVCAEYDRVAREGQSYVKDFKPLRLGILRLEKGRGPLTLRALRVAGAQVMDLRSVTLTLIKY